MGVAFDFSMNSKSHPHLNLPPEREDFKAIISIRIRFTSSLFRTQVNPIKNF
jgi:hypothetical protein